MRRAWFIVAIVLLASAAATIGMLLGRSASLVKLSPTAALQRPDSDLRIVCFESDGQRSKLWSALPSSVADTKRTILTVPHPEGYPLTGSLSPAGDFLAYLVLPENGKPELNGVLWVVGVSPEKLTTSQRRIDSNVDYGWPPKWSDDGKSFMYVKTVTAEEEYHDIYVGNVSGEKRRIFAGRGSLDVLPVGWSSDGESVYIDKIEDEGDWLCRVDRTSGQLSRIAQLSDSAAWNLTLSPDKTQVAGSVLANRQQGEYAAIEVSTESGEKRVLAEGARRHYSPLWSRDGSTLTTDVPPPDGERRPKVVNLQAGASAQRGAAPLELEVEWPEAQTVTPIGWSPDQRWLVLKFYRGSSVQIGLVRDGTGAVQLISPADWVDYLGWMRSPGRASAPLQVREVAFLNTHMAGGERTFAVAAFPAAAPPGIVLKAGDRVNVIQITFSRAVAEEGFGKAGSPQNVIVEPMTRGAIPTDSMIVAENVVRLTVAAGQFATANIPGSFRPGSYRLRALTKGTAVKARDDLSVLDGDFDGTAGGDFVLNFRVIGR